MVRRTIGRSLVALSAVCWLGSLGVVVSGAQNQSPLQPAPRPVVSGHRGTLFVTGENCIACHNGLSTNSGEDISIGTSWRATMMANSSRDPYWQAAVRRETIDHPEAATEIERECSVCHMPMSHTTERASGRPAKIFDHLPLDQRREELDLLAADGVSCAARPQELSLTARPGPGRWRGIGRRR